MTSYDPGTHLDLLLECVAKVEKAQNDVLDGLKTIANLPVDYKWLPNKLQERNAYRTLAYVKQLPRTEAGLVTATGKIESYLASTEFIHQIGDDIANSLLKTKSGKNPISALKLAWQELDAENIASLAGVKSTAKVSAPVPAAVTTPTPGPAPAVATAAVTGPTYTGATVTVPAPPPNTGPAPAVELGAATQKAADALMNPHFGVADFEELIQQVRDALAGMIHDGTPPTEAQVTALIDRLRAALDKLVKGGARPAALRDWLKEVYGDLLELMLAVDSEVLLRRPDFNEHLFLEHLRRVLTVLDAMKRDGISLADDPARQLSAKQLSDNWGRATTKLGLLTQSQIDAGKAPSDGPDRTRTLAMSITIQRTLEQLYASLAENFRAANPSEPALL